MAAAAQWMSEMSGVKPALGPVPKGIEVYPRYGKKDGKNKIMYVLVSFAKGEETITLPTQMQDVLEGGTKRSVTLPRFGVAVLSATE